MRLDKKSGPIMYTLTLPNDLNAKLSSRICISFSSDVKQKGVR